MGWPVSQRAADMAAENERKIVKAEKEMADSAKKSSGKK